MALGAENDSGPKCRKTLHKRLWITLVLGKTCVPSVENIAQKLVHYNEYRALCKNTDGKGSLDIANRL